MVRILKVKELEARKQALLKRSEVYRQTMGVELANIKYSVAVMQRKVRITKSTLLLLAGLAGFFLMRKRSRSQSEPAEGLLAKLRSGIKFFGLSWPLLRNFFGRGPAGGQNGGTEEAADAF